MLTLKSVVYYIPETVTEPRDFVDHLLLIAPDYAFILHFVNVSYYYLFFLCLLSNMNSHFWILILLIFNIEKILKER